MTSEYTARLALVIGGEWIAAGSRDTHSVINPATGSVLAELPLADPADLDHALAAAARGFASWRATPADERGAALAGAARLLRTRADHIAAIATLEQGKPLAEVRAEVGYAAALVDFYAGEAKRA